jgi:septal ring factor EnvC (AmiA/AmiB activator)
MGLGLLKAVPLWAWALAAALLWGAWQRHAAQAIVAQCTAAQLQASAEREEALSDSLKKVQQRIADQEKVVADAKAQNAKIAATAAEYDTALSRLRSQLATVRARAASGNSPTASRGEADVLTRLLEESAGGYREMAAAADRSTIAGLACERSYDALRK